MNAEHMHDNGEHQRADGVSGKPLPALVNREARVARWACALTIAFALSIFLPGWMGADMMDWGYGSAMLASFAALCCGVTWAVFWRRARMLDRILRGEGVIARWVIEPDLWRRSSEEEYREDKSEKRALFWIVAFFAILCGVGFVVFDPDAGRWVLLVMVLLLAVLAPFAFWLPGWRHRRRLLRGGVVAIARSGAYVAGTLHDWGLVGCSLDGVEIVGTGGSCELVIEYSAPSRVSGRESATVRIPIPPDDQAGAEVAARALADVVKPGDEDRAEHAVDR